MCIVKTEKKPRKTVNTHDGTIELSKVYQYSIEQTIIIGHVPEGTDNPSYKIVELEVAGDVGLKINPEVADEIKAAIINYHKRNGIGAES